MPAPKLIADAERDVHRAVLAARSLGATATAGLELAEHVLAEVRHFAYCVSEAETITPRDVERLVSSIVGFPVSVDIDCPRQQAVAYSRLVR